jgi:threonine dehydrogenase-like Zn-dependent dehydrogenase
MRAVLMEQGKIWVDEIDTPTPGPGEVLVKSRACGICGSDLHAARHTRDFVETSRAAGGAFKLTTYAPVVLGHEFCAEIVDYGVDTQRLLKPGQLACSVPMLMRAQPLAVGYSDEIPGGFAQYMLLSERFLLPVPDGTPAVAAALTEPLAVGLHAVNKAGLSGGETVIVMGAGPVGLAVITALADRNVGPVIAADYSTARRNYALAQGADIVCDPAAASPFDELKRNEHDVVVFECVGVPGMLDNIFMNAPQNTRIIVVGVCLQTDNLRPLIAINKELSLQFVLGYSMDEFATSLRNICDGRFDVANLVSHEIGLDDVADTFAALQDPERYAKVMVTPND